MFGELGRRSALSPSHLGIAIVMTIIAVVLMGHAISDWATKGKALSLALLWLPIVAFNWWRIVQSELDWSDSRRRVLVRVRIAMTAFFGVLCVYGLYAWSSLGADLVLPLVSFAYLVLGILGPRQGLAALRRPARAV